MHDDSTFEPYPKTRSFARSARAQQYVDDETGRDLGWSVFAVTAMTPEAAERGTPTNAQPVGETAREPFWRDGHWRQDVKTDMAGMWVTAVVD